MHGGPPARVDNVLMWSSLCFTIPAWYLPSGREWVLKWLVGWLVFTSVWYHHGHTDTARLVDVVTVRIVLIAALWTAAWSNARGRRSSLVCLLLILVIHLLPICHKEDDVTLHTWAHMSLHIIGATGLTALCR